VRADNAARWRVMVNDIEVDTFPIHLDDDTDVRLVFDSDDNEGWLEVFYVTDA